MRDRARERRSALRTLVLALFVSAASCAGPALRAPEVKSVAWEATIWSSSSMGTARVLYQDGGQSIPVTGGSLWLFGDTFLGAQRAEHEHEPPAKELQPNFAGAVSATIALLAAGETSIPPQLAYFAGQDGKAADPLTYFPGESAERNRMWPLGGSEIGGRVYVYYLMIEVTDAPAPWNFKGVGGGLAVAHTALDNYTRLAPNGNWRYPVEPIQVMQDGEFVYLFEVGDGSAGKPKGLIVARVRPAAIEDPAAYEFLVRADDPPRWERSREHAVALLDDVAGQVSIARQPDGGFLMATSSDFFHPREIALRTSRGLLGPWSEPTRIPVPDFPAKQTDLVYCTFLHPELSRFTKGGAEWVLTFCRMLHGEWELSNPEILRVSLH